MKNKQTFFCYLIKKISKFTCSTLWVDCFEGIVIRKIQECHVLTLKFDCNSDDNYFSEVYCNDVAQALRSFFKRDIFFKNAMEGVIVSRKVQKITLYIDRKTTIHNSTQRCENVSRNLYDNSGFTSGLGLDYFHKTQKSLRKL